MSVTITIKNALKKYEENVVIPDLSLVINNGELFTLLGPSGCGKTTLLRMIIGFNSIEGGEIKIETKLNDDLSKVIISISDNGTGIPKEVVGRIFEPFFTTKDVGEGTGLGMSIAYKTIERHNGKISLNSVEGEGTNFDIELPVKQ